MTETRAIILAAGRGSRMGALTDAEPKCKTVLHGKTLIDWQRSALSQAGVIEQAVVVGYQRDRILKPETRFVNECWSTSNMVRSLLCAAEWLRKYNCIISYSDIVYSSQLVKDLAADTSDKLAVAYDENWLQLWRLRFEDPCSDAESFKLGGDHILEIGQDIKSVDEPEGQYMGLLRFTPSSWRHVENYLNAQSPEQVDKLAMTSLLQQLIEQKVPLKAVKNTHAWYEVDNENDLNIYQSLQPVTAD